MAYGQFTANPKLYEHHGWVTPNIEVSEGFRPDYFFPAPWLPVKRYDKHYEVYFSISAGQIVSLDQDGHLVPTGLSSVTYTTDDVGETYDIATGELVVTGNVGVARTLSDYIGISDRPVGVVPYNCLAYYGGVIATARTGDANVFTFECDPNRPMHEKYTNFNIQASVAILTDWYIQIPWIGDSEDEAALSTRASTYAHAYGTMAGRTDYASGTADALFHPGGFVCADTTNPGMFVPYDSNSHDWHDVIGQLLKIDSRYPKNYLERVHTYDAKGNFGTMDQMPGTATRGMDYQISIATDGAYRAAIDAGSTPELKTKTMFKINLIFR